MSGYPNSQGNPAGAIPVYGGGFTLATNGDVVDPNGWAATYNYNGDGTLNYVQVTNPTTSAVYQQSFTYSGGAVATRTGWVKQ